MKLFTQEKMSAKNVESNCQLYTNIDPVRLPRKDQQDQLWETVAKTDW